MKNTAFSSPGCSPKLDFSGRPLSRRAINLLGLTTLLSISGCGGGVDSDQAPDFVSNLPARPTIGEKSFFARQQALSLRGDVERQAIVDTNQMSTWAYYQDATRSRWYISQINTSGKVGVFSLGPIQNGKASWRTVADSAASVNLNNGKVTIDAGLTNTISDWFFDVGLGEYFSDPSIHNDCRMIQNSAVDIAWYFFLAPNGMWYITLPKKFFPSEVSVLRFSAKNGQYDWIPVDVKDVVRYESTPLTGSGQRIKLVDHPVNSFIDGYLGKSTNMDGAYGAQCVDLMHAYIDAALVIPYPHGFTGNAYPIYANAAADTVKSSTLFGSVTFSKIANSSTIAPQKGDIIFWSSALGAGSGHVGVFIEGNLNRFTSIDQNWYNSSATVGSPAAIVEHNYTNVVGWLRPNIRQ